MFRQRLLTALILVPLVLLAIYYANPWLLCVIGAGIFLALNWEWLALIPVKKLPIKLLFLILSLILIIPSFMWLTIYLWINLAVWGLILVAVLTFPQSQYYWGNRWTVGGVCLFILPLFLSSLYAMFQLAQGRDLFVYLLCLVWATDIGAYLAGKQWGQHKLIPKVSPGKTWEGALGGVVLALLIAGIGYFYFRPPCSFLWVGLAISVILISMLGDLFISMLKRRSHLKDTGNILPGHGGVLDRLDSLIAALPLFYFIYQVS